MEDFPSHHSVGPELGTCPPAPRLMTSSQLPSLTSFPHHSSVLPSALPGSFSHQPLTHLYTDGLQGSILLHSPHHLPAVDDSPYISISSRHLSLNPGPLAPLAFTLDQF